MRDRILRELGEEMHGVRTDEIVVCHNWSKIRLANADVGANGAKRAHTHAHTSHTLIAQTHMHAGAH